MLNRDSRRIDRQAGSTLHGGNQSCHPHLPPVRGRNPASQAFAGIDPLKQLPIHVLLLAVCGAISGCGDGSAEPALNFAEVHTWSMPVEGATIPAPRAMTWGPDNQLFVLDNSGRVLVFSGEDGKLVRKWHMPAWDVGRAEGICIFKDGRIGIADTHYHRVVFFNLAGELLKDRMHGSFGKEPGQFIYPVGITQDADENYYVCEYGGGDRVQKFRADGELLLEFGRFGVEPGEFQRPSGILWHDGQIFVADAINNRIQVFKDSGEFVRILGAPDAVPPLHYPYDVALGPDGFLFAVEYGSGQVSRLDMTGRVVGVFGTTGTGHGQFFTPWGLAVDDTGRVVVADTGNRRIVELTP